MFAGYVILASLLRQPIGNNPIKLTLLALCTVFWMGQVMFLEPSSSKR
jgi:hypothetical protein